MKKELVATVMIMSIALVMVGCGGTANTNTQEPSTQAIVMEKEATVVSYNKNIELGTGETLSLDLLNIVTDGDIEFNFEERTYDEVGVYDEVISYEGGELVVKVTVVDKTAPVISGIQDIEVVEGTAIDILNGVSTSEEAELSVSAYDSALLDVAQKVTVTATDTAGNTSEVTINLTIKSNPIQTLDKTMYAKSSVNVRAGASSDTEKIGHLSTNEKVHVTGQDKNTGWYQIEYNDSVGYVSNDYLSDSKVSTDNSTGGGSSSQQDNGGSSEEGSQSTDKDNTFSGDFPVDSRTPGEVLADDIEAFKKAGRWDDEMKQRFIDAGYIDENENILIP